jgi:hypothetical protein
MAPEVPRLGPKMAALLLALAIVPGGLAAQESMARSPAAGQARGLAGPPHAAAAQRFLAQRGWRAGFRRGNPNAAATISVSTQGQGSLSPTWTPLGPAAVQTQNFGLISGRISSLAFDPADPSGNLLYVGTTGGGVWKAQNAASSSPVFYPLTDVVSALGGAWDASISIGALTVQPDATGVILAGTGDPNDTLDSYYGTGILRSTDGGTTWSLISRTVDVESGLGSQNYLFGGEGFAGFAWSTADPQVVVAAVSQAYEGVLVDALRPYASLQGLYYSTDSGADWHLATISDGSGGHVQGPLDSFPKPDGNAATAVVWNPKRQLFIAAVRYHGYYQSPDGVTWTRLDAQPGMNANSGAGLTTKNCPTNTGRTGSIACPIFRGALAVDPVTGDTYAWTVDANKQDQGLWRDACSFANGACATPQITFAEPWDTTALEINTLSGPATIVDGDYNLTLAVVPVGQAASPVQQDVRVLAGAHDLWETSCPVSQGCTWRNTTNATTCMSAQVGEFQHALAWNPANPLEVFVGNDSGLWRSLDAIGANSGDPACSSSDASHFQNLNGQFQNGDGSMGSLAEVTSLSPVLSSPYSLMAGLGVNGTAGVKNTAATANWPQMLSGYGGPVAIPSGDEDSWYVNGQAGVAIYLCAQPGACTAADFGASPVVSNADVGGDGYGMPVPAAFIVDPLAPAQLLIATCRVWRGSGSGGGAAMHAVTRIVDNLSAPGPCQGDALIRSIAAMALTPTTEIVYVGLYGGTKLSGHLLTATIDTTSAALPAWTDLTANQVSNDTARLNAQGLDISSIVIDPSAPGGKTVYVTVQGISEFGMVVQTVYRSTDGGATWYAVTSNLPNTPVSALALDPQNANIVYVGTDDGVYYTTEIAACQNAPSNCWSPFGIGLPAAPVVALSAASGSSSDPVLVAGTYGRGLWQTALWTAGSNLGAVSANPGSLTFSSQISGTASIAKTVTLVNTGSIPLTIGAISKSGNGDDFSAAGCTDQPVPAGSSCDLQVTFTPQAAGPRTAVMMVSANVYGGQLTVDLNGTGLPAGNVAVDPMSVSFGATKVGSTSAAESITLTNTAAPVLSISSVATAAPFAIVSNTCGAGSTAPNPCQIRVTFTPTVAGPATGLLTVTGADGTETVQLNGTGAAPPTDILTPASLTFPSTPVGQISAVQGVTISNTGDLPLHLTAITASANFQQSGDCLGGVAAQSSCSISVQFAPTQSGALTGTLTIADDLGTRTVALSGTGLQPGVLSATPASLVFSQQQPGVASAPQTVTIANSGGIAVAGLALQIAGPAAQSYSLGLVTCGSVLNSGANCTVQVAFTPQAAGPIAATLNISSSTPGVMAVQVPLNGSGQITAGLTATPAQLLFTPAVGIGRVSNAQAVTITNTSSFTVASVSLKSDGPFSVAQNACTGGLGPGASCSAAVVFTPLATGAATGTLTVSSSEVASPATVALSGSGFDFTVAPLGPSTATVSSGQQADFKLQITPNGADGSFSFQCGTLPAYALCLFSPATESLGSGVQGTLGVQIYTGNSSLTAGTQPLVGAGRWPLFCGLALLPLGLIRRRKLFLLVLLAVVLSAGTSSCTSAIGGTNGKGGSGGSGGQGNTQTTPPGTYSIPVTVTSAEISHSTQLTLTVD